MQAALDVYLDARKKTLTLRSMQAMIAEQDRLELLIRGMGLALAFAEQDEAKRNTELRQKRLKMAEEFLIDAETKYKMTPAAAFMRGEYAASTGETRQAITRIGLVPVDSGPPEELQAFVKSEIVRWGDVVKRSGASFE